MTNPNGQEKTHDNYNDLLIEQYLYFFWSKKAEYKQVLKKTNPPV